LRGTHLAKRRALLPGLDGGGPVVRALGLLGALFGLLALLRGAAGGKAPFEAAAVVLRIIGEARKVEGLGERRGQHHRKQDERSEPAPEHAMLPSSMAASMARMPAADEAP
jgi:hypothetical protein